MIERAREAREQKARQKAAAEEHRRLLAAVDDSGSPRARKESKDSKIDGKPDRMDVSADRSGPPPFAAPAGDYRPPPPFDAAPSPAPSVVSVADPFWREAKDQAPSLTASQQSTLDGSALAGVAGG